MKYTVKRSIRTPLDLAQSLGVADRLSGMPVISKMTDEDGTPRVEIDLPGVDLTDKERTALGALAVAEGWGDTIQLQPKEESLKEVVQ